MCSITGPERLRIDSGQFSSIIQRTFFFFSFCLLASSPLYPVLIYEDELHAETSHPFWISSAGSKLLGFSPLFIAGGSPVLSGACWLQQFSVIAGNLPGSESPRMAKAMHADQSVDDCSCLSGFFAKRCPESQSQ